MASGSKSRWRPVKSDVPRGSVPELVLFSVFMREADRGTECTLSRFANDTKLSSAGDSRTGYHPAGPG